MGRRRYRRGAWTVKSQVTKNEAEYRLKDLVDPIQGAGKAPADYSLLVRTDSQFIVGQLTKGWQVKAANLRPLVDEARSQVQAFGRCDLVKLPRGEIVRVLGHWGRGHHADPHRSAVPLDPPGPMPGMRNLELFLSSCPRGHLAFRPIGRQSEKS